MKLKLTLTAAFLAAATAAQAGPQFFVSFGTGGACAPRPVYCPPQRVFYQQPNWGQTVRVISYNQAPVYYAQPGFTNRRVVQPVFVQRPVCNQRPVLVQQQPRFGWRR